jgi:hypothetical protein
MGFLDNSGDIILDAVLTDSGRARLAKGDGSFRIVKFALGDDEIDYENYDLNASTARQDLEIMQTPVFEALTNDDSSMKSKLVSYARTDLLYLPMIIPNEQEQSYKRHSSGTWIVAVDQNTVGTQTTPGLVIANATTATPSGILNGYRPGAVGAASIRTDQGIDNAAIPAASTLDASLVETQYLVLMDNRFGTIVDVQGNSKSKSFVDDDNIATYVFTQNESTNGSTMVGDIGSEDPSSIEGARGTFFNFKILASTNLQTSNFLFNEVGATGLSVAGASTLTCRYIDTNITIMGMDTGYKVDIPVRFVKKQ